MKDKLLPERLIQVREALGLSLSEAARRTGIDKVSLWRYEQGTMGPSDTALRIIALYLGTSTAYLTGKTDDPAPDMLPVPVDNKTADFVRDYASLDKEQQEAVLGIIKIFRRGQ